MSDYQFDTKCIQSGYHPGNAEPRTLPIYQSTTYKYDDADALGQLFALKAEGHMYSRISNPTVLHQSCPKREKAMSLSAVLKS